LEHLRNCQTNRADLTTLTIRGVNKLESEVSALVDLDKAATFDNQNKEEDPTVEQMQERSLRTLKTGLRKVSLRFDKY